MDSTPPICHPKTSFDWSKEMDKNLQDDKEMQKQLWLERSREQPGRNKDLESAQPDVHHQAVQPDAILMDKHHWTHTMSLLCRTLATVFLIS